MEIRTLGDQKFSIINPVLHTRTEGSPSTLEALQYFETPRLMGDAIATGKIALQDLEGLLQNVLIIDVDLLVERVPIAIGKSVMLADFLGGTSAAGAATIIGAPVDIATTRASGARYGPTDVRSAYPRFGEEAVNIFDFEFRRSYGGIGKIIDLGNVRIVPGESIHTYGMRLAKIVELALNADTIPIVIGGDHSITAPLLQACSRKYPSLGVIHFDAHHDMYLNPIGPYEVLTHGTPFRFVLNQPISYLMQLGLRTLEQPPDHAHVTNDPRLRYFASRELQHMEPERVFSSIPRTVPCYVSFDIDCVAPDLAPETGSPVPGGLSYYQALDLLDYIASNFRVVGADFVEVSRSSSSQFNRAAQIVARYIAHLILAPCSKSPIIDYLHNY